MKKKLFKSSNIDASETKQIVYETRMKSPSSETATTTHTVNVRFVSRQTRTKHR